MGSWKPLARLLVNIRQRAVMGTILKKKLKKCLCCRQTYQELSPEGLNFIQESTVGFLAKNLNEEYSGLTEASHYSPQRYVFNDFWDIRINPFLPQFGKIWVFKRAW